MKRYFFNILAMVLGTICTHAQEPLFRKIELPFGCDPYGFSSIAFMNDMLYLPSEDKGKIFHIYPGDINARDIKLEGDPSSREIEGATVLNNTLYLVSEKNTAVYQVSILNKKLIQLAADIILPAQDEYGSGIEGIATNGRDKLYLMLEKTMIGIKTAGILITFSINQAVTPIKLVHLRKDTIYLPGSIYRYADIFFDNTTKRLLLLRSACNDYAIEALNVDGNGFIIKSEPEAIGDNKELTEIAIKFYKEGYSHNLEGIALDSQGHLYIISDNYYKSKPDPAHCKTLLLRSAKTYWKKETR